MQRRGLAGPGAWRWVLSAFRTRSRFLQCPSPWGRCRTGRQLLMEGKEVWEGRKGSVSLATSDSLASLQIHLKPTGLRVKDLPQGHGELEW